MASRAAASPLTQSFGDLLAARVAVRESQLVLGLDPDPMALWPTAEPSADPSAPPAELAGRAVLAHCRAVIDAAAEACVAVKLQLACFERLGAPGWRALALAAAHAREQGLLVIADGKRGDIALSAKAYAQALTGGVPTPFGMAGGLGAELATVNPLLGRDAVEPFLEGARSVGGGVLLLVRTSNPGASDLQDLPLEEGGALWERIALLVEELAGERLGRTGLGDVGAVMGATEPRHLERARELMPHAFFLLPGVGAQGGRVEDLRAAFLPGRAGGLITASRAIVEAHRGAGGEPASAARTEAERLRALAWSHV